MALSESVVQELLKKPKQEDLIKKALLHEERILFHAEVVDRVEDAPYYKRFIEKVKNILLDTKKVATFESILETPFRTVAINNRIQDIQKKVFESQDGYIEVHTDNNEDRETILNYLDDLEESAFWEEEGFTTRYNECNKLLVVDINESGDPFFYTKGWSLVHDIELQYDKIQYVIFKEGDSRRLVIDDESYRVYDKTDKYEWVLSNQGFHLLGYCPVAFVVSTPLNERVNPLTRWSSLSPVIGTLDRYLFIYTAKNHYELYAAMPPMWMYQVEVDCGNPDCNDGYIEHHETGAMVACKTCAENRDSQTQLRAGSVLIVPPPMDNQDADLRDPVGKVDADKGALEFNSTNTEALANAIIESVTGVSSNIVGQEALNEKQVKAQLDSERGSLLFLAKDIAKTRKWLIDTIARIKIPGSFITSTVNMGTDFFLLSELQEINEYNQLRTSGISRFLLSVKQDQIRQRMVRSKPIIRDRAAILEEIEPATQSSVSECIELYKEGLISRLDLIVKINFSDFVRKFEQEIGSVTEYLKNAEAKERVKSIKDKIYEYGKDKERNLPERLSIGVGGSGGQVPVSQEPQRVDSGAPMEGVR